MIPSCLTEATEQAHTVPDLDSLQRVTDLIATVARIVVPPCGLARPIDHRKPICDQALFNNLECLLRCSELLSQLPALPWHLHPDDHQAILAH